MLNWLICLDDSNAQKQMVTQHTFTSWSQLSLLLVRNVWTSDDGTNKDHSKPEFCHILETVDSPCNN